MTETISFSINQLSSVLLQAFLAFVVATALTPVYTHFAFKHKAWKQARTNAVTGEAAPVYQKLHAAKHKRLIPTMAGVVMILAISVVTISLNWSRSQTYLPLFVLVAAGIVGLIDDYLNIRGENLAVAGMRAKLKFMLILGIAAASALYFYFKLDFSIIHVPAVGDFDIGLWYIPLFMLVIVSTANAVNITDGLDGLSGGLLALAFSAFAVIAMAQGNYGIAGFCAAAVGAVLSYTWFNIFPARFFMGDSGSFALGTALGVVAMLTNSVFVLPIIGAVFVAEAGSSSIQILSKRIRKKKIFLSAPIHHHFEAIGWPETKVTMRFWVIGAVTAVCGIIIGLITRG